MSGTFLGRALWEPVYGWSRNGELSRPSNSELLRAFASRMNVFASRKAWLGVMVWGFTLAFLPFAIVFLTRFSSWPLMLAGFLYSMVWLGMSGTVYLHRFGTHHAFTFKNRFVRLLCANMAIKIVPEEVYIVSHHVHHAYSDEPGDPYNARAGWLYCFLAAELHQQIAPDLSERDYERVAHLLRHTGLRPNSYEGYRKWGTVTNPLRLFAHYVANWAFWYAAFYLVGGHALATALFGWSLVWAVGIRAHNYDLHAGGKDRRREGRDFDTGSLAVNAVWPGLVAGEWHNNHHLFPTSVRAGFLPSQPDVAFGFIWLLRKLGGVQSWRDGRAKFFERYYEPYLAKRSAVEVRGADELDESASKAS